MLTCWLIFVLHFATDFVREHYLVLSIVEDCSFRLDKYVGLHPDIFETPDNGAHHGANPGASMIAAIPYAVFKPVIDGVEDYTKKIKQPVRKGEAVYNDERIARVRFYKQVHERGLDIKFGFAGLITMAFCMAPLAALSAVVMFSVMGSLGLSTTLSLWLSLLYALGTPIFFRTAYLNQNLMVGIFGFLAFILLWDPGKDSKWKTWQRIGLAGFLSGLALLCDYSGIIVLFILGGYALLRRMDSVSFRHSLKDSLWYVGGAIGPIALLWLYQWRSFGHPFYPPQFSMPPQTYSEIGYQGIHWPSGELLWLLLFNPQVGLFINAPILLLAIFAPVMTFFKKNIVPVRETLVILFFFISFTLFFSSLEYTKLQWITGIRYLIPVIPFLFMLTASVMIRMPRIVAYWLAICAFAESWCMSMARTVGIQNKGVIDAVVRVFLEGFQLPWVNTLSKMGQQYAPFLEKYGVSAIPFFVLWGSLIYTIWRIEYPWKNLNEK